VVSNLEIIQQLTSLYQVDIRTLETLINDYNQKYNNLLIPYIIDSDTKNRIHRMDDTELQRITSSVKFTSILSLFYFEAIVGKYQDVIKQHKDISREIELELEDL
jgi:hypothetical protein